MVFIHCKNCGHDKHEGKCGNAHNHMAIGCMCSDYQEGRIDNINQLMQYIQLVNKQDIDYRTKKMKGETVNMDRWVINYLKLYALNDRYNKHFGIMNYSTSDPI